MIIPGLPMPLAMGGFNANFGDFIEGGYFAGVISDNGLLYAIIVAPKASGEIASIMWKDANSTGPIETQTLTNGPLATAAMVVHGTAGTYPAAHWANNLSINGFDDWYLPARDELELIWRNLKPVTNSNSTGNRTTSAYTYNRDGNTNDASGDTVGVNRHSVPAGAAYTSGNPEQTSVLAFRSGGAEAMEFGTADVYWSSSEYDSSNAWVHIYRSAVPGGQNRANKSSSYRARAVRRVEI